MFDLARKASTEELAHYVERRRKGVERNRIAVDGNQRRLDASDDDPPGNSRDWLSSNTREELFVLQQKAQLELRQYEIALRIAMAVLNERRQ